MSKDIGWIGHRCERCKNELTEKCCSCMHNISGHDEDDAGCYFEPTKEEIK